MRTLRRWFGLQSLDDKACDAIYALAAVGYDEGYTRRSRVKQLHDLADYAYSLAEMLDRSQPGDER